jgi:hypothetical protein
MRAGIPCHVAMRILGVTIHHLPEHDYCVGTEYSIPQLSDILQLGGVFSHVSRYDLPWARLVAGPVAWHENSHYR